VHHALRLAGSRPAHASQITFKVKKTTQFRKIKDAFVKKEGISVRRRRNCHARAAQPGSQRRLTWPHLRAAPGLATQASALRLMFDGNRIEDEATPESVRRPRAHRVRCGPSHADARRPRAPQMGMEENDVIDATLEATGGACA